MWLTDSHRNWGAHINSKVTNCFYMYSDLPKSTATENLSTLIDQSGMVWLWVKDKANQKSDQGPIKPYDNVQYGDFLNWFSMIMSTWMKEVKHHAPYSAKSSPLFSTSLPGLVVVVKTTVVVEMMVVMVNMVVVVKNKMMMAIKIVWCGNLLFGGNLGVLQQKVTKISFTYSPTLCP